jgi:UDP-glucuronate 4-epimerase
MAVLVTGVAGFIGFHVASALLRRGERVVGLDNVNAYYDPRLKEARLAELAPKGDFSLHRIDIADRDAVMAVVAREQDVDGIVHLAAQAGVRYSLENPYAYIDANVMGQTVMLEAARRLKKLRLMVYASSSSVYGGNKKQPFSVDDRVDAPVSLYAATKRACELIAESYAHVYRLPSVGLRFFTVYGPWGRPDMAAYLFTDAILAGRPIRVFNNGAMARDFTFVDDIVAGTLAALDRADERLHRVYNLGNHRPEKLLDFVAVLEKALGRTAQKEFLPLQPGDVPESFADIHASRRDLGFDPKTPIHVGIPRFVEWYKAYHKIA